MVSFKRKNVQNGCNLRSLETTPIGIIQKTNRVEEPEIAHFTNDIQQKTPHILCCIYWLTKLWSSDFYLSIAIVLITQFYDFMLQKNDLWKMPRKRISPTYIQFSITTGNRTRANSHTTSRTFTADPEIAHHEHDMTFPWMYAIFTRYAGRQPHVRYWSGFLGGRLMVPGVSENWIRVGEIRFLGHFFISRSFVT